MSIAIWIIAAFISGSLPFSVWLGRLALQKDIRTYGDGNPGATNVFKAGGRWVGVLAVVLDALKGIIPVSLASMINGVQGWSLVAIALAPLFGHAFSPFLRFKGGKAVAVTFGVWIGLTLWHAPIVLGVMLFYWFKAVTISGWALLFALLSLLLYLLLIQAEWVWIAVWLGSTLLLVWKYRHDLRQPPGLRNRSAAA